MGFESINKYEIIIYDILFFFHYYTNGFKLSEKSYLSNIVIFQNDGPRVSWRYLTKDFGASKLTVPTTAKRI